MAENTIHVDVGSYHKPSGLDESRVSISTTNHDKVLENRIRETLKDLKIDFKEEKINIGSRGGETNVFTIEKNPESLQRFTQGLSAAYYGAEVKRSDTKEHITATLEQCIKAAADKDGKLSLGKLQNLVDITPIIDFWRGAEAINGPGSKNDILKIGNETINLGKLGITFDNSTIPENPEAPTVVIRGGNPGRSR